MCRAHLSTLDLDRSIVRVLLLFFRDTQDVGDGISDEVLFFHGESSVGVLDHGGEVGSSEGALVGYGQVLGLCEVHSRAQGVHQLVQVLRVVVIARVVQERTLDVGEMLFMLLGVGGNLG